MSTPECPPKSPLTVSFLKMYSPEGGLVASFLLMTVSPPPAEPMVIVPTDSESMLMSSLLSISISCGFRANAPVSPVSSSTVARISIGPCLTSGSNSNASANDIPIPLSAPKVVSSASIHSPFFWILIGIGSLSKSKPPSRSVSQTMSRCPCNRIGGRDSIPGVAGFFTRILPVSSSLMVTVTPSALAVS